MASPRKDMQDKKSDVTTVIPHQPGGFYKVHTILDSGLLLYSSSNSSTISGQLTLNVYNPLNQDTVATFLAPYGSDSVTCLPLLNNQFVYQFYKASTNETVSLQLFDAVGKKQDVLFEGYFPCKMTKIPGSERQIIGIDRNMMEVITLESKEKNPIKCSEKILDLHPSENEELLFVGSSQNNIITVSKNSSEANPIEKTIVKQWKLVPTTNSCILEDRKEVKIWPTQVSLLGNHLALARFKKIAIYNFAESKKVNSIEIPTRGGICAIQLINDDFIAVATVTEKEIQFYNFNENTKTFSIPMPDTARSMILSLAGDMYCGVQKHGIMQIRHPLKEFFLKQAKIIETSTNLPKDTSEIVTEYLITERSKIMGTRRAVETPDETEMPDESNQPKRPPAGSS